jgi:hypothetical protein
MKITLTQTGGWANVQLGCTLDTAELSPEQAREVEALLSPPSLAILRSLGSAAGSEAPDDLQYRLEAKTEGETKVACYSDAGKPDSLRRLLEAMRPNFRPIPRRRPVTSR